MMGLVSLQEVTVTWRLCAGQEEGPLPEPGLLAPGPCAPVCRMGETSAVGTHPVCGPLCRNLSHFAPRPVLGNQT